MSDRTYYLILDLYNEASDIFYELSEDARSKFYARLHSTNA